MSHVAATSVADLVLSGKLSLKSSHEFVEIGSGARYLIHGRDPLFTDAFEAILESHGIKGVSHRRPGEWQGRTSLATRWNADFHLREAD